MRKDKVYKVKRKEKGNDERGKDCKKNEGKERLEGKDESINRRESV